tara:strand:- start:9 stop:671 length:663 start_codon:yes stop_codon:yes gene_type:complete
MSFGHAAGSVAPDGTPAVVGPDHKTTAATVYITQRADIDDYFDISCGEGIDSSAIAIKADEVRLVARGVIKLVTGTDARKSGMNSAAKTGGIELIAGNDCARLQPMVLGNNLRECLNVLQKNILDLKGLLRKHVQNQRSINLRLLSHQHISGWQIPNTNVVQSLPPVAIIPDMALSITQDISQVEMGCIAFGSKMKLWRQNYIGKTPSESEILSGLNKTN